MLRPNRPVRGWWGDVISSLRDEYGDWFECNTRRVVGDGENTSFWLDNWTGPANLKFLFPRFFHRCLDKLCSVARAGEWAGDEWIWKVGWRRQFRDCERPILNELFNMLESRKDPTAQRDSWKWEIETSGEYSVRSSYYLLLSRKIVPNRGVTKLCNLIWRNAATEKAKAIVWRVLFRKIATKTELKRRGALPPNVTVACSLCGEKDESVEHLFFECKPVSVLWGGFLGWIGVQAPLASSGNDCLVQFCSLLRPKFNRTFLATLWICVVWKIWKARNNVIFNQEEWSHDCIVGDIKSAMWVWVSTSKLLLKPDKSFREWCLCPW